MKHIILILLLFFTASLHAQNKVIPVNHEVVIDFTQKNSITLPKRIKPGEFYRVIVNNLNLNNYGVALKSADTVYNQKALEFPGFSNVNISELPFTTLQTSAFPEFKELYKAATGGPATVEDKVKAKLDEAKLLIDRLEIDLNSKSQELTNLNYDFAKARILAKAEPMMTFTAIDISTKLQAFKGIRDDLKSYADDISALQLDMNTFFEDATIQAFMATAEGKKLTAEKVKREEALKKRKEELGKINEQVSNENIEKIMTSIYQLYQTTTYTSLPIQFNGEEAIVEVSFIPKDSASNLQTMHLEPIRFGRSPWYTSVGPSLYYSSLSNQRVGSQTVQINDSTQNFRVLPESSLDGELGVAALFHAGRKLEIDGAQIGIHLSVGTGISLADKVRPRMLYGGGLAIVRRHHLVLDVGWSTGQIDRISQTFLDNDGYNQTYPEKPEVIIQEIDTKFFFSVGYMFRL